VLSLAGIRLRSWESARAFKGIICADVSEFESYMPSHAVRSLWRFAEAVLRGRVTPILLFDGFEGVNYRCKGCRSEVKRTFKRRSGAWEVVTLPSFLALRP
jgi:hypothetical protein